MHQQITHVSVENEEFRKDTYSFENSLTFYKGGLKAYLVIQWYIQIQILS